MPVFDYKAKKKNGETISAQVSAQTREEAVDLISRMDLLPVAVTERKSPSTSEGRFQRNRVRSKEIYVLTRQLANLLKAGVPILRALLVLSEQISNNYLKDIILEIHRGIKDGRSFSECLKNYPEVFSPFYVAMVSAGEEGGKLKEMVQRLASYLRSRQEFLSRIRTASAYPAFMALVGLGTVIFMFAFVMPRMTDLFGTFDQQLPTATRILMVFSQSLQNWWLLWVLGLGVLILPVLRWSRTKPGRLALGRMKLGLPLLRDWTLKAELTHFCRTLALLLESGVSLLQAIEVSIPTLSNEIIKEDLRKCRQDLAGGSSFGESLRTIGVVPPVMVHSISVGEESGALPGTLNDIADAYEQETDEAVKTAMTLLEPLMILAVGLVIGFMVIAMLLPIFQMDIMAR